MGNKKTCLVKGIGYNATGKQVGADKSDSTFTIQVVDVTSPKSGDMYVSNDKPTISWISHGTKHPVANAKLYYSKDGGYTWKLITKVVGDPGSYPDWVVPPVDSPKTRCKVKVVLRDANGETVGSGVDEGTFTISPP